MYDVYLDYWIMIQIMRRIIKTRGTIFSMAYCNNSWKQIYENHAKINSNVAGNVSFQQAFISRLLKTNVEMMPLSTAINV